LIERYRSAKRAEKGQILDTTEARRTHLVGWVFAAFRVGDLMSSLYGEGTPGLDVRIYDGVDVGPETLMYPDDGAAVAATPARFDAQEFIGFAGHTWTVAVRSTPGRGSEFQIWMRATCRSPGARPRTASSSALACAAGRPWVSAEWVRWGSIPSRTVRSAAWTLDRSVRSWIWFPR